MARQGRGECIFGLMGGVKEHEREEVYIWFNGRKKRERGERGERERERKSCIFGLMQ